MIVKMVAPLGICSGPEPLAKNERRLGKILSFVNACKTLGAPNKLPTALDSVAPQTPNRIANPQNAIFCIIKGSRIKVFESSPFSKNNRHGHINNITNTNC